MLTGIDFVSPQYSSHAKAAESNCGSLMSRSAIEGMNTHVWKPDARLVHACCICMYIDKTSKVPRNVHGHTHLV